MRSSTGSPKTWTSVGNGLPSESARPTTSWPRRCPAICPARRSAALGAAVERLGPDDPRDFPGTLRRLDQIIEQVGGRLRHAAATAREQWATLECSDGARARIGALLDASDLVNAQEFLAQVAAGAHELPPEAEVDTNVRRVLA